MGAAGTPKDFAIMPAASATPCACSLSLHYSTRKASRRGVINAVASSATVKFKIRRRGPENWSSHSLVGEEEGRQLTYSMIGHSGGGQFLSRFAAFIPNQARHIVIANSSTYVFPDLHTAAPYGLGGVYEPAAAEVELRRYVEQPVTIFLSQEDIGIKDRSDPAPARAQGKTRYQRGRNVHKACTKVARAKGWICNWHLIEVSGVGHSAKEMFASKQAIDLLLP
jgi:pimeloyl-ACP methyl ester carboxylesterase